MAEADGELAKPKRPRRPREPSFADSPDPIEIAMKAVATGADRHSAARAVLEKHASLIDKQCAREDEELRILRLRRLTRWLILAAVGATLLGIGAAVWAASRSNSLVIEPFEVPPALEQRGISGRVVSSRVLDSLAQLQRETESMRGEMSYADNWRDDIKLAIPETGMSLGDAWRALKSWLGEETRISGEVVQTPTGLAISTRAGSVSGDVVEGTEAEVDQLIKAAAKSIYKVTQPYRYAISLTEDESGIAERIQVLTGLTGHPSPDERKWAFSGLSATYRPIGEVGKAKAMAQRALAIDSKLLPALGNLSLAEYYLGHDEAVIGLSNRWEELDEEAKSGQYDPRVTAANRAGDRQLVAQLLGDAAEIERQADAFEQLGTLTSFGTAVASYRAEAAFIRHDHDRAVRLLSSLLSSRDPRTQAFARYGLAGLRMDIAADLRDGAGVRQHAATFELAANQLPQGPDRQADVLRRKAQIALAFGRAGVADEAQRRSAALPADCYPCLRAKGWAASAAGDRPAAARFFREALSRAPSIPFAYADLGALMLVAGDVAKAEAQFQLA
ncbi:MAG TPA: hypothetical protein VNT25_05875, partial [Allosphingosinicella sp.]|nr:hypothetical protein [Allosphingosinicella sp.]